MTYQSKTDWKYDDIVKETDLNRIEQGIHNAHAELDKVTSVPITLKSGLQAITTDHDTPLKVINIQGRTLINLLGRDGNCEDINRWGKYQVTNELDPDNKTNGVYGLKTISAMGTGGASLSVARVDFKEDRFYILLGMLKNGTGNDTSLSVSSFLSSTRSNLVTNKERFELAYAKISGLTNDQSRIAVNITGPPGTYSFADEIRIYEITKEEYNAIDTMTPEQVAAKYPYLDSLQNVNAVYIVTKAVDGRKSYMYLPTCQFAASMDGSTADRMYIDNEGKPRAVRQLRRMELDGGLPWTFHKNNTGFKSVKLDNVGSQGISGSQNVVKYTGSLLSRNPSLSTLDSSHLHSNQQTLYVTIPNSDSGWGPDYEPSQDEIKAYFYGWVMFNSTAGPNPDTPANNVFNDSGAKQWCRRTDGANRGSWRDSTSTVPTTMAPEFTPYLLQYQLAAPVDEPLEHEGILMLYEGTNQVEVGTGIVVREKVEPFLGNGKWNINNTNWSRQSVLDHQARYLKEIYKDGVADKTWSRVNSPASINGQFAQSLYGDPSSVYQVTYLALDAYKIGIAPTEISTEYAENLRGTVDSLVRESKNALTRITVLENEKVMKEQPQWIGIAPILINGWEAWSFEISPVAYFKDASGIVHLRGAIKSGIVDSIAFKLPQGYRPQFRSSYAQVSVNATGTRILGEIRVLPNGDVHIMPGMGNAFLSLDGIAFRAEN